MERRRNEGKRSWPESEERENKDNKRAVAAAAAAAGRRRSLDILYIYYIHVQVQIDWIYVISLADECERERAKTKSGIREKRGYKFVYMQYRGEISNEREEKRRRSRLHSLGALLQKEHRNRGHYYYVVAYYKYIRASFSSVIYILTAGAKIARARAVRKARGKQAHVREVLI